MHREIHRTWHLAIIAFALLVASPALAMTDVKLELEPIAWSKANQLFAVKLIDGMRGPAFSVRELKTGKEVEFRSFLPDEEKRVWKRLVKKHGLTDELHAGQASKSGATTIVDKASPGKVEIMVMAEGMVGTLATVDLPKDRTTKKSANGRVKSVHWADGDKWIIVVVNHVLEGQFGEDRDTAYTYKYRRWKIDWK